MFKSIACLNFFWNCCAATIKTILSVVNTIKQTDWIHSELVFPAGSHLTAVREDRKLDFVWSIPPTHITPVCYTLVLTNAQVHTDHSSVGHVNYSASIGLCTGH